MTPVFCFIDDSRFELDVFKECIVPAAPGVEFIQGSTYEAVRERLGDRYPCLFLLDLYGRDPEIPAPRILSREELEATTQSVPSLDAVYDGLAEFPGDPVNEFLKRLFHAVDPWRRVFLQASRTAGQNTAYGLANLATVHRDYPAAATVAYTRKSMISDAVDVLAAGVDGLNLKPDGPTDQAIRRATTAAAPGLLESWSHRVTERFTTYLQSLVVLLVRSGLGDQVSRLGDPNRLSGEAQDLLGPGEMSFLRTAAAWWAYTGMAPII